MAAENANSAGALARAWQEDIAARIRALPFTPDTTSGDRQGLMRENAARTVEGRELLVWEPAQRVTSGDGKLRRAALGATCDLEMWLQAKDRIAELEALLLEEQQARHKAATRLAQYEAAAGALSPTATRVVVVDGPEAKVQVRITELAGRLSRLEELVQRIDRRTEACS